MNLKTIEVQNFFNHSYSSIDFAQFNEPVLLTGENGAGKSSIILESLTFALFGETRLESLDDCIKHDCDFTGVSVVFEINNQIIDVTRTKKRGKTAKLIISIDGTPVEELLTDTQKRLDKILGLSYDAFRSSIILKQDDSEFFIKAKPQERKKIIREILDLNQYEKLEKLAKEERNIIKNQIAAEESLFNLIEIKNSEELQKKLDILEKGVKKTKLELIKFEKELSEIVSFNAVIKEQIKQKDDIIANNQKIKSLITILENKIKTSQDSISYNEREINDFIKYCDGISDVKLLENNLVNLVDELASLEQKLKDIKIECKNATQKAIASLQTELREPTEKFNQIKAEAKAIQQKLEKSNSLEEIECPMCFQNVSNEHIHSLKKDLEAKGKSLLLEYKKYEKIVQQLNNSLKDYQLEIHDELKSFKESEKKLDGLISDRKKDIQIRRLELKDLLEKQKSHDIAKEKQNSLFDIIAENQSHLLNLKEQIKDIPTIELQEKPENEMRKFVQEAKSNLEQASNMMNKISNEIEQNEMQKLKKKEVEGRLSEKIRKVNILSKLAIALGDKGIPALIIATVLPEIEENANYFLNKMSQGLLELRFQTTAILKSGEERDTLDIEIFDGKTWRSFNSLSGGEKFRASLSIRLALSKVLARRANIDLQLLILDEPASALDGPGRELFVQTVHSLKNDFSKILIISHLDDLVNSFDSRIHLIKTDDGSKIMVTR